MNDSNKNRVISAEEKPLDKIDAEKYFERAKLRNGDYFSDFINEAYNAGLIGESDAERIEFSISELLKGRIEAFTRGESSSIGSNLAKKLAKSAVFVLGIALKNFGSRLAALDFLLNTPFGDIFAKGQEIIASKISYAKLLLRKIERNIFRTENVFWNVTLNGIKGFFAFYTPSFFAAETHITADYPPFFGYPDSVGIEFVCDYLKAIYFENAFLNRFPLDNVDKLLKCREGEYKSSPLNLFEPVFAAAICAKISGVPAFELVADERKVDEFISDERKVGEFTSDECKVDEFIAEKSVSELPVRVAEETLDQLEIFGETRNYALKAAPKIFRLLFAARSNGTLGRMFLPRRDGSFGIGSVTLSYGERMDGEKYANLLNSLAVAEKIDEKKKLITENITSFADLFEVVVDADFAAEELTEIFSALPVEVVAGLIRRFASAELSTDKRERNVLFSLTNYEKSLSDDMKKLLSEMSEKIEFEPF